jgi:hypothetical protein
VSLRRRTDRRRGRARVDAMRRDGDGGGTVRAGDAMLTGVVVSNGRSWKRMAGTHRHHGPLGRGGEPGVSAAVAGTETGIHMRVGSRGTCRVQSMSVMKTVRPLIQLKRELLAPPRLTGWTPFPMRVPQFPQFFFSIFEWELNIESSLSV